MKKQRNPPLATYFVFAYNSEKYIREAVEAAFAQTYTPLEILLSDDCSSDQTFAIMRDMANDYVGTHTVRLNRNEHNLGTGEHNNKIVELSNGEFLIKADGDDISLPERTQTLVDHFVSHPKCNSVYSNMNIIDMAGVVSRPLRPSGWAPPRRSLLQLCRKGIYVFGNTHAWRKQVFDIYGPIDSQVIHADIAIPFRSSLSGTVDYLDEILVLYRRHDSNLWSSIQEIDSCDALIKYLKKYAEDGVAVRTTMLKDFLHFIEISKQEKSIFKAEISALKRGVLVAELQRDLLNCPSRLGRARLLIAAALRGAWIRSLVRLALLGFAPRILLARIQKKNQSS